MILASNRSGFENIPNKFIKQAKRQRNGDSQTMSTTVSCGPGRHWNKVLTQYILYFHRNNSYHRWKLLIVHLMADLYPKLLSCNFMIFFHYKSGLRHVPCFGQWDVSRSLTSTYKFLLALFHNWVCAFLHPDMVMKHTGLAHGTMNNICSWGKWPTPRSS